MAFSRPFSAFLTGRADTVAYTALSSRTTGFLASPGKMWHRSRFGRMCVYTAVALCLVMGVSVYSRDRLPAAMGGGGGGSSDSADTSSSSPPSSLSRIRASREQYIDAVLRNPVEGLLDPEPIRQKCNETRFQEGLVWHCSTIVGGIGNVGNMWLNCVRYAIEAGATTLVLPRLGARGDDLIDLQDHAADLSVLFDVDYFLESWQAACPQMRAVVSDTEVAEVRALPDDRSPRLAPSRVKAFPMRKYLIVDPTGWRDAFDAWLTSTVPGPPVSAAHPVRVHQDMVLAQWNRETELPAFRTAFPRLFRYPQQTRRLAAAVLWRLEQWLGRPVVADAILQPEESSSSSIGGTLGPGRLAPDGFFGAHLRVAADAAAAGWPRYEAQAPFFLQEAQRRNMSTIYLATGSAEHRAQFVQNAAAVNNGSSSTLTVVFKEKLLDAEELAALQALTWDQQALVDYDVLLRSTWFYGFVRSSFSWGLALRRGTLPEAGPSQVTEALGDEYRDSLSAVVGRYPNINPEGLWP